MTGRHVKLDGFTYCTTAPAVRVGEPVRLVNGATGIVTSIHGGGVTVATPDGVRCYPADAFGRAA